jgi:hypothetical protein
VKVGAHHVWMYWEDPPGGRRPPYLTLCEETVVRHLGPSMELHVLDQDSAFDWLPDLNPSVWHRLASPVQRADYVRTRVVYRHGGLWIDSDCIAMRRLDGVTDHLGSHDLVSWGEDVDGRFFNNVFAGRAGAPMLAEWIEGQDRALASVDDWSSLPWAALGSGSFSSVRRNPALLNLPSAKVAPVLWYEWRRFLSPFQSPAAVLRAAPWTVMLWNAVMGPALKRRTTEELLGSHMLVSRLFRIALGRTSPDDEMDRRTRLSRASDLRYSRAGRSAEIRMRRWLDHSAT